MLLPELRSAESLLEEWCALRGISSAALRSRSRARHLRAARAYAAAYLRRLGCSLPEIGRALGARHHTTIIAMLRRQAWTADHT